MELSPHWEIAYEGSVEPKHTDNLWEAKRFVAEHEVTSVKFHVSVLITPRSAFERKYAKCEISKEEMATLDDNWLKSRLGEARMSAQDYIETGHD